MSTILERLKALAGMAAVSGQEQPLVAYLREAVAPLCDAIEIDAVGDLYAIRRAAADGPTVMVAAHTADRAKVVAHTVKRLGPRWLRPAPSPG